MCTLHLAGGAYDYNHLHQLQFFLLSLLQDSSLIFQQSRGLRAARHLAGDCATFTAIHTSEDTTSIFSALGLSVYTPPKLIFNFLEFELIAPF